MADLMPTSYNNADPALSACGSPNAYVTIEGIEFTTNKYGVVRQQNPIPFQYDLHYLAKQLEAAIELGTRAGGESGTTCCQRIAPFGATSNTFSLDSHVMVWPLPWHRLLPWL